MATQKDRTADDLGASPRSSGSRSTLQSSAKKRKDLRSDRSRARAQAAAAKKADEAWDIAGWSYTPSMAELYLSGRVEKLEHKVGAILKAVVALVNALAAENVVEQVPAALGARRKPTKEAVPASRRTGAKRSPKGTGRGSAKATPNT